MPSLDEHPTVRRFHATAATRPERATVVEATWLRQLCRDAGADDVGFVAIQQPEVAEQRADILRFFPPTKTLISFVCRMNRTPIRSPARSVANVEFHHTGEHVNAVAHRIVAALEAHGVRAANPAMGFPMEMERWSVSQTWVVAHKPIAVAAGLGQICASYRWRFSGSGPQVSTPRTTSPSRAMSHSRPPSSFATRRCRYSRATLARLIST